MKKNYFCKISAKRRGGTPICEIDYFFKKLSKCLKNEEEKNIIKNKLWPPHDPSTYIYPTPSHSDNQHDARYVLKKNGHCINVLGKSWISHIL